MILIELLKSAKRWSWALVLAAGLLVLWSQDCSARKRAAADRKRIQELSQKLAAAEKTIEIDEGLYAKTVLQVKDLLVVIDKADGRLVELQRQLKESGDRLAAAQDLVLTWKKRYEGAVEAHQTEEPGEDPDGDGPVPPVVRKRVDFEKEWGYIGVHGHTLTDPPEGYIVVEQLRPLKLLVGFAKGKDGQYRAYVKSSEENVQVDIDMAALDLDVIKEKKTWRDRLWVEGIVSPLGERGVGLGVSYDLERYSFGVLCQSADRLSCGVTFGSRLFK